MTREYELKEDAAGADLLDVVARADVYDDVLEVAEFSGDVEGFCERYEGRRVCQVHGHEVRGATERVGVRLDRGQVRMRGLRRW